MRFQDDPVVEFQFLKVQNLQVSMWLHQMAFRLQAVEASPSLGLQGGFEECMCIDLPVPLPVPLFPRFPEPNLPTL